MIFQNNFWCCCWTVLQFEVNKDFIVILNLLYFDRLSELIHRRSTFLLSVE